MHGSLDYDVARVDSRPVPDLAALEDFLGEEVMDREGNSVGIFACYWEREEKKALLLGVDIPGRSGRTHLVPARGARLSERRTYVQVAFARDKIIQAPCLACECEIDDAFEQRIWAFYGLPVPGSETVDLLSQKVEAIQRQLRRIMPPDAAPGACRPIPAASTTPASGSHPPSSAPETSPVPAVPPASADASPRDQSGCSERGRPLEKDQPE